MAGRLARARALLAKRLARRGVTLSGGALAAVLSQNGESAGVPTSVMSSTIKAASLFAAGQAAGMISVKVAALTDGVLKAMFLTKLKTATAVLLVMAIGIGGAGAGSRLHQTEAAERPKAQRATEKANNEKQPTAAANPKKPATKSVYDFARDFGMSDIQAFLLVEAWQGQM